MPAVRSVARSGLSTCVLLAILLPTGVAAGTALHAMEHRAAAEEEVPLDEVAALAAHGHTHAAVTPPHEHGAPPPAAGAAPLVEPLSAETALVAPTLLDLHATSLRAPSPRSRGSGGDLLLRLSCVLLL